MSEPFAHTSGPRDARVVMIGEAHGEQEAEFGEPFVGSSGREFARMLIDAGWDKDGLLEFAVRQPNVYTWIEARREWLNAASVMLTNVFAERPPSNNLGFWCAHKTELPSDYELPPIRSENPRYIKPDYLPHLPRLSNEIKQFPRNLILGLGGTAAWALTGSHAIGKLRGAIAASSSHAPIYYSQQQYPIWKVLSTYHPAGIMRNWSWRPIVLADLLKARREREYAEIRRPKRNVLINPTIEQVEDWVRGLFSSEPPAYLAPDIETMNGQIRCIGFASARDNAIVIPFIRDLSGASYWSSLELEVRAWRAVRELLACSVPKLFQNGLFDMQYLARAGLRIVNAQHDTMLLHHVLYPEMQKSLGFLGSIYTNEAAWKTMRLHKGEEELKRDE